MCWPFGAREDLALEASQEAEAGEAGEENVCKLRAEIFVQVYGEGVKICTLSKLLAAMALAMHVA